MAPDQGRNIRREAISYGQLDLAARTVRVLGELLGEAKIFPEGVGGAGEDTRIINLANRRLSLQFGSYHAQIVIVEDTLSFECEEGDHKGPEYGVRAGHLGITFHVDVKFDDSSEGNTIDRRSA